MRKNSPEAIYCNKCAFPIDAETFEWENKVMNELVKNPKIFKQVKLITTKSNV